MAKKISSEVSVEIRKIRASMDDMYDKLNVTLYKKNIATKVSYSEVNPFNSVIDNFEYISTIIRGILGLHYPSDVLIATAIGWTVASAASTLVAL